MEQRLSKHGPEDWPARARSGASMGGGSDRPQGALPAGYGRNGAVTSRDLPVYVNLDLLFPLPEGVAPCTDVQLAAGPWQPGRDREPGDVGAGVVQRGRLVCTGEVRGILHRWERRAEGPWIAVVSYAVPMAGEPRPNLRIERALVPAQAVRPVPEQQDTARQ